MNRVIHELQQGSEGWHAHRANHYNASEAPAMMGVSQYKTRSALIAEKATGVGEEITEAKQALFDAGHSHEATARPWAEEIIGSELYPLTASADVDGLPLSASYDGATMDEDVIFEHKHLNQALMVSLSEGKIPSEYHPQMEQQLLILGAERCLFMASAGDKETMRWAWYQSDPVLRAQLIAGWKQFREDVANYAPTAVAPPIIVAPPTSLPALVVELVGQVTKSNLKEFEAFALAKIGAIKTELNSDEDFAEAAQMVKFLDDAEKKLELAKSAALTQAQPIDELFRTIDTLKEQMKAKRLNLDKSVEARKINLREEIRGTGNTRYAEHVKALNERLGRSLITLVTQPSPDFAGVMKGKRNFASMRDAVDTELARVKIESNQLADRIQANLATLATQPDFTFLFPDSNQIVLKNKDDFDTLFKARIAEHKHKEAARIEADRERIRKEEEARAVAEQQRLTQAALKTDFSPIFSGEPAATPAPATTQQRVTPAPIKPATMREATDGVQLRFLIDQELDQMENTQLQAALVAVKSIREQQLQAA